MEAVGLGEPDFEDGTPFLTQFHDDLGALLDAILTERGDDDEVTRELIQHTRDRFDTALGKEDERPVEVMVIWLDPVSIDLADPSGRQVKYDLSAGTLLNTIQRAFVSAIGNIEVIVIPRPAGSASSLNRTSVAATATETYMLTVDDVSARARGGVVFFRQGRPPEELALTDDLRDGVKEFPLHF